MSATKMLTILDSCSRQLREGTLAENGLQNDSRLTLLPSVETGLLVSLNSRVLQLARGY